MKTPEQKADELIDKYLNLPINFPDIDTIDKQCIGSGYMTYNSAVKCAIIEVDRIIYQIDCIDTYLGNLSEQIGFWQSVKTELEKLKN